MVEVIQLLVNGVAVGCIYGMIALGFVLIYKATEAVNFAQGDIMMLGAFAALTFVAVLGLNYWIGLLLAIVVLAIFGYLLDAIVLRPIIGQPQFAIVMLTIGLGFIFRTVAGAVWGHDPQSFDTPFTGKVASIGQLVIGQENLAIIIGTALLCLVLYMFFTRTRIGVAMQASSQNQLAAYYMGIPVKRVFSMIWAISAGVATVAGVLLSPLTLVDPDTMGFFGIKAFAAAVLGGFGSIPGALLGGIIIGIVEQFAGRYLAAGFQETSAYLVLLAVLVVRPSGIFGQIGQKKV